MDFDVVIIGAGVVGLALAERLSRQKMQIVVVEKEASFGRGVSSRNSEVIHAGLYYPENSLKAMLCVEGREMLYRFCDENGVPHRRCGKLIVATEEADQAELDRIEKRAIACGVDDLMRLTSSEVSEMEPMVTARSALYSPATGIVSAHHLMAKLYRKAKKRGVLFSFETELTGAETLNSGTELQVRYRDDGVETFTSGVVINASGLFSDQVGKLLGLSHPDAELHWWKGEYASLDLPPGSLNTLVYPVPNAANTGLGIHTTVGLDGTTRLGPNATYLPLKEEAYGVEMAHLEEFFRAVSRYLGGITPEMINPSMAGIRPKRQMPADPVKDFLIKSDSARGHIHLIGIESPGLTASLAIARYVAEL